MAATQTSIRLDLDLADQAVRLLGVKTRTEAVHIALREIVNVERFKELLRKHEGMGSFDRSCE
jgi:Arc/MetJ family transcription regulator